MKKVLMMAGIVFLLAAIASCGKPKTVELKFGHYSVETHPAHLAAVQFAEAVAERTKGAVTVTIFPNSKLGSSQEMVEQTVMGALDFVIPTEPALAKYSKKFNLVGGPFAFKDYESVDAFFSGGFLDWVNPDLEKAGLHYLGRWEWGFRTYTNSKKPIEKPSDMRGMKIRTPPDFVNAETVKALGGNAQTIAFAELPMALKQGVVDGQENPIGVIYSGKMWETQKYLSILNYTYVGTHLIMNKASFGRLSKAQQKIVEEEAVRAGEFMMQTVRDMEAGQIQEMEGFGMKVNRPDVAPFKEATASVWDALKAQVGDADFATFQDYLKAAE